MRRCLSTCCRSAFANVALSSALLFGLWSPGQAQEAPPPPAGATSGAPGNAAAPKASSPAANAPSGPTQGKILYTVPEDGLGAVDVPIGSRLVRDLIDQHPSEDVIICLAGCRSSVDRVVYTQPMDVIPAKPAAVSESNPTAPVKPEIKNAQEKPAAQTSEAKPEIKSAVKPAAEPVAASDAKPVADTAAKDAPQSAKPAAEAAKTTKDAATEGATLPQLVPTMAMPKDGESAAKADAVQPPAADAKPSADADAAAKPADAPSESKAQ